MGSVMLQRGLGVLRWNRAPSPSLSQPMFPPPAWTFLGPPNSSIGACAHLPLHPSRRSATGPWHWLPELPTRGSGRPSPPSPPRPDCALRVGCSCVSQRTPRPGPSHVLCPSTWGGPHLGPPRVDRGLGPGTGRCSWQARGPLVGVWGHLPAARGGRRRQPDVRLDVSGLQSAAPGLDHRGLCVCTCDSA